MISFALAFPTAHLDSVGRGGTASIGADADVGRPPPLTRHHVSLTAAPAQGRVGCFGGRPPDRKASP